MSEKFVCIEQGRSTWQGPQNKVPLHLIGFGYLGREPDAWRISKPHTRYMITHSRVEAQVCALTGWEVVPLYFSTRPPVEDLVSREEVVALLTQCEEVFAQEVRQHAECHLDLTIGMQFATLLGQIAAKVKTMEACK